MNEVEKTRVMRFQKRDGNVLMAIHNHDGVVARRHLKYLFWPDKTWRAMERRLSLLKANEYINWPNLEQRKTHPVPEPVVWLGWKGAMYLAGRAGIEIDKPPKTTEYQLRKLERNLRERGFHWLREPRWIQLKYDLTVTDLRFWMISSLHGIENLNLEEWVNESAFRIQTDYIDYEIKSFKDDIWIKKRRGVCPDGYFTIADQERKAKDQSYLARFLLEVDMASHSNPSFGIEKVAAGSAYVLSHQFRNRFGSNVANWLVVTTGPVRMKNLIMQTRERAQGNARMFYFTTLDYMPKHNFFLDPIWQKANVQGTVPLIKS